MSISDIDSLTRLQRAAAALEGMEARLEAQERARIEPIAIIGMGCRFPGGVDTPEAFWRLLEVGVDTVTEIPAERWVAEPGGAAELRGARWGAFLKDLDLFEPSFFGISPREAERLDPQQRLLLEVSWEALEDAGIVPERLMGSRTGVFMGILNDDYRQLSTGGNPDLIDLYTATGNGHCFPPGRLSYVLDLQGPSLAVDTACSSSLVAVHLACQSLRSGESALALACGVNVMLSPAIMMVYAKTKALSPDGRCHSFDARANGFVRGEGCGVLVLKRLSDAQADGDRVLAVIRGSAVNQDGRSTGLTAPNVLSQQAMLRGALKSARVSASEITYIEAHGTGTPLGDAIEVEALAEVLGKPRADGSTCVLGAVKTNVGHLEAAAGIAGIMKVVLSMQHEAIPRNLHFQRLNQLISLEGTPLVIPTETMPWKAGDKPRFAGVSAFGMSGTNAHVVLAEAPRPPPVAAAQPAPAAREVHLLPLSARSPEALRARAQDYQRFLKASSEGAPAPSSLEDIGYTAALRRSHHEHRLAIVGRSRQEIIASLEAFSRGKPHHGVSSGYAAPGAPRRLVFVFSGQGSQWIGMGRELLEKEEVFRASMGQCDALLRAQGGWSLLEELNRDTASSRLDDTEIAQPALFALQIALAALWRSWGVSPDAVVGHSVGEVAAAHVAGILSLEDAVRVVFHRGRVMQQTAGQGAMAAVELPEEEVQQALVGYGNRLAIAAMNSPSSVVVSGEQGALDELLAALAQRDVLCRRLPVRHAFHSPQMDPLRGELAQSLQGLTPKAAEIPVASTVTGRRGDGVDWDAAYWARNVRAPVRFAGAIEGLIEQGHEVFLEIGPHPVLVRPIEQLLQSHARARSGGAAVLGSLRRDQPEQTLLLESLGALFTLGLPVAWQRLYPAGGRCVPLPAYPWQRERFWIDEQLEAHSAYRGQAGASAPSREAIPSRWGEGPPDPTGQDRGQQSIDDWLYELVWQPQEAESARDAAAEDPFALPGMWLIFADQGGVGRDLAARLSACGQAPILVMADLLRAGESEGGVGTEPWRVDPAQPESMRQLLAAALGADRPPCRGIVHLFSLDAQAAEDAPASALEAAQTLSCLSALHLVQALQSAGLKPPPRLWLVTRGAQPAGADPIATGVAQAPLWGLGRTVLQEYPALSPHLVDLDPAAGAPEDADLLMSELRAIGREDQIAFRGGQRLVARLGRHRRAPERALRWRKDASYLITGGLGGLGLAVASWMVEQGARRLILLGRSKLPPRSTWKQVDATTPEGRAIAVIQRIEALGANVHLGAVDVADEAQLAAFLEAFEREGWLPIRGVIHAAGRLVDRSLQRLDRQALLDVLAPKVKGSWSLCRLLAGVPLDFFVLFSSVASTLGSMGQANYAAANAFMDALAHALRGRGRPALSIGWGPWAEVGMAAAQANRGERLALQGIEGIAPSKGLTALGALLRGDAAQVSVMAVDWRRRAEADPAVRESPLLGALVREEDSGPLPADDAGDVPRKSVLDTLLGSAEPAEIRQRLEDYLREQVAHVLRIAPEKLDPERRLHSFGIDSLMAIEVKNRTERDLGSGVPVVRFLEGPSVRELAHELFGSLKDEAPASPALPLPGPENAQGNEVIPLSYGQRAMWFIHKLAPESTAYNITFAVRIGVGLDVPSLCHAFQVLVARHAMLRTTYVLCDDEVSLCVPERADAHVELIDASAWSTEHLEGHLMLEASRPFDLTRGPVMRVQLFAEPGGEHIMLLNVHHIAVDFWSFVVLLEELGLIYTAHKSGTALALPPLPARYVDFTTWQAKMLASEEGERHWVYWREELRGELPTLNLRTDRPRPPVQTYRGASFAFSLSAELSEQIRILTRTEGTTVYTLLLTAFHILLHRMTGQDDILVGSPAAGRSRNEFVSLIGYFVNLVVLRARLGDNPSFREALARSHQIVLGAISHQDYPFPLLVERLQPPRDSSRSPILQIVFVLQKPHRLDEVASFALGESGAHMRLGELAIESVALPERVAQFDLMLMMVEAEGTFRASLQYNTDLFDASTMQRLAGHFQTLLGAIVANPEERIGELSMLTTPERQQLLMAWNNTGVKYPVERPVHELFEIQASRSPEAVAVVFEEQQITYRELNERANRLAHHLRALGVGPEVLVGICVERSLEMVIGLMGILKAGGA